MGCKISPKSVGKVLQSVTEFLDSKYRGQLYSIQDFQIKAGCNELDNFLSSVYKVKVIIRLNGNSEETNGNSSSSLQEQGFDFVCKSTILDEDGVRDSLQKYYWTILFAKENAVYELLQKWRKSLEEDEAEHLLNLHPVLHHCYTEGEEYSCLLMEDLNEGFYMPKTTEEGLSLEECKVIMRSLARLHAISLVMEGRDMSPLPAQHELVTTELLFSSPLESAVKPLTTNSFTGFLRLLEKFRPDLLPHVKRIEDDENIWTRLCGMVQPGKTLFTVLCHGDSRLNNIFIKKSPDSETKGSNGHADAEPEEKIVEDEALRFIDFQLTRYASPVTDISYTLHMGTTRAFREKYTEEALKTYYNEFQAVLRRFSGKGKDLVQAEGVKAWTLDKLREEYEAFYMYGFLVSVILLPMILLREGDIDKSVSQMTKADRDQFFGDGRADLVFKVGSKNAMMRERLFELCDEMVQKNVISTTPSA